MSDITRQIERVKALENARRLNERTAQTAIVFPLLRALGWDTTDPDEVVQEHPVGGHLKGYADIVLMSRGKPLVLVETKAPEKGRLDVEKNLRQMFDYCKMLQTELGVLSNGIEWHFYLVGPQSANPALSDRIDLIGDDSDICANKLQQMLSRDKVSDAGAQTFARKAYIRRMIAKEWRKLLENGDSRIVSRLRTVVKEALVVKVSKADLAGIEEFVRQQALHIAGSAIPQKEALAGSLEGSMSVRNPADLPEAVAPMPVHGKAGGDESSEFGAGKSRKPISRPTHIEAFGQRYGVRFWKDVLVEYASAAYLRNPELFHASLEQVSARKSPLFVQSEAEPERMQRPVRISDSNLWVETHRSSENIMKWCQEFQELLHLEQETLRIYQGDVLLS